MVDRRFALRSMIFITDLKIDFFFEILCIESSSSSSTFTQKTNSNRTYFNQVMTQPIHDFHVDRWGMMMTMPTLDIGNNDDD